MELAIDALRLTGAAVLCLLALAAVIDRHQGLLSYLGRLLDRVLRTLVVTLTFGRVRLPQIIRTSRRRAARRRRIKRLGGGPASTGPAGSPPSGWRAGSPGRSSPSWSGDETPPGLG